MTAIGRLLRLPLRLIPVEAVVPILAGKARGTKWIAHSGLHRFWLGTFERGNRRIFERTVRPGHVVYDIGAHVGIYTVLASRIVGKTGKVVAFEPLPRNLVYLRRHIEMNQLGNVTVIDAAVSDTTGIAHFAECGHATSHIGQGPLRVRTVGIDDLIAAGFDAPDVIKMDIEGGESVALASMKELLRTRGPTLFLSTHSEQLNIECFATLLAFGYSINPIDGNPIATTREVLAH